MLTDKEFKIFFKENYDKIVTENILIRYREFKQYHKERFNRDKFSEKLVKSFIESNNLHRT